jgi:secondary thiamine-phosphate synthase enzyme
VLWSLALAPTRFWPEVGLLHGVQIPYFLKGRILRRGKVDLRIFNEGLKLSTRGEIGFFDISGDVQGVVDKSGILNGIAHVFAPHATGVLILTEYEPSLLADIKSALETLVPRRGGYAHPSNAHAHLRSMLLSPDKTLPVIDGKAVLGTWQSLVFVETDVHPRQRTIIVQVLGE